MTTASARLLVGRRIAAYDARTFDRGRAGERCVAHDPIITLDNGATLTFSTEETETGEYGVRVLYHPPPK